MSETRTTSSTSSAPSPREVRKEQQERYGGVKPFVAFLGWLTATGVAVLLTAVVAAIGAGVGLGTGTSSAGGARQLAQQNGVSASDVGWGSAVVLAVIVFVAYYAGGYVAGRMARFDGIRQGVAVWVWALVVSIVLAVVAVVGGSQYDVLGQVNAFPRIPGSVSDLGLVGIVALLIVAVTSLVGAIVGGLAGMAFHRRVDRVGLSH